MEYRPIDPRTYGVRLISEPPRRIETDRNVIAPRQGRLATNNKPFAVLEASTPNQTHSEPEGGTQMSNEKTSTDQSYNEQLSPPPPANVLVTRSLLRTNPPQVSATETSEQEARRKIQREKRKTRARENRRQHYRQTIARELGRDVNSITAADMQEYSNRRSEHYAAEKGRRQALSAAERYTEDIQAVARYFEKHVHTEFGPYSKRPYPVFLLQLAPDSVQGAECRLRHCDTKILPDDYRIAVEPGEKHWSGSPDHYHLECFEELLDLSSLTYATRFQPDIHYFPGHMEANILREYIQRWVSRLSAQEHAFPEHIWGPSVNKVEPERYFVSETDLDYDERHSLSKALTAYLEYRCQRA
ncbi:hypothetical protein BDW59DRAFT_151903 [Aspergillus cavernicola]|uniref:BZIP domain-containing protein n=1 Tax=Aspergillus cavernicola TaxID=176166 RepID=A0ABR4HUA2_9EURO